MSGDLTGLCLYIDILYLYYISLVYYLFAWLCFFGPMVKNLVLWFSIYAVLWIWSKNTGLKTISSTKNYVVKNNSPLQRNGMAAFPKTIKK